MAALIELHGLSVEIPTPGGWIRPVNDVSLALEAGESLGLVGESGSGKTMLSLALMGLLPPGARVSGEARLASNDANGKSPTGHTEAEGRAGRGCEIAMIFQEPMTSLNPVMRIGPQIEEAILAHEPAIAKAALHHRLLTAMEHASLPEREVRAQQFPHHSPAA